MTEPTSAKRLLDDMGCICTSIVERFDAEPAAIAALIHQDNTHMGVSENSGFSPQIIHFNRVFHYKPSILGYPYFWKHPYTLISRRLIMRGSIIDRTVSSPLKSIDSDLM